MAEIVESTDFWLPSEFLPDDFFSVEKTTQVPKTDNTALSFPNEFPYDYDSNLSSPVESVTETESDEEEYMAGLMRQMAHSFLLDDPNAPPNKHKTPMACSPQSTLFAGVEKTWSRKENAWDLMVRMTLEEEIEQQKQRGVAGGRGVLGPPRNPSPPVPNPGKNTGYYATPTLTHHQLQINQFNHLKQQQMLKQQQQQCGGAWGRQNTRPRCVGGGARGGGRPLGLCPSAWPPLSQTQQHPNAGMRAVFLGTPSARKQPCGGTGVFLPRRAGGGNGNTNEFRKKPSCSTVLLPARVVQALNLNLEEMGAHPRFPGGFVLDHDVIIARNNALLSQKRSLRSQPQFSGDFRLPPDWTY